MAIAGDLYIVDEDITAALPDGRVVILAHKGEGMHINEARERGFIKDAQPTGPTEIKSDAPAAVPKIGKGGTSSKPIKLTGADPA